MQIRVAKHPYLRKTHQTNVVCKKTSNNPACRTSVSSRGGVEDTRLEAKAKDTKKIRGQGQPFRGQTLSRPRTGMLEAKAKDQGHKRKCSPKKKVFTKIFQAISTKKRFPKNSSSAPQNFNNSKNSAVLEPRTGQFSRTWGLEAKAKDLTFEAKAKDFKICPQGRLRGQGRPRGLHLWLAERRKLVLISCLAWIKVFSSQAMQNGFTHLKFYEKQ